MTLGVVVGLVPAGTATSTAAPSAPDLTAADTEGRRTVPEGQTVGSHRPAATSIAVDEGGKGGRKETPTIGKSHI